MSLKALILGWGDLLRPRVFRLVLLGILLTILLFALLQAGVFWGIRWFAPEHLTLPMIGQVSLGALLSWGSLALFPLMGFFLMAPVAAAFSGLFAEKIADEVEALHYPAEAAQPLDFWDGMLESLAVAGLALLIALVSLILTPFLGPFAPLLFYGANGWLLGREFFAMAARRHLAPEAAEALRRRRGPQIVTLGVMIAVLLSVPLVNIAVPVLAAASFTHLFHLSRDRNSARDRRG